MSGEAWHIVGIPVHLSGFEVRPLCRLIEFFYINLGKPYFFMDLALGTGQLSYISLVYSQQKIPRGSIPCLAITTMTVYL